MKHYRRMQFRLSRIQLCRPLSLSDDVMKIYDALKVFFFSLICHTSKVDVNRLIPSMCAQPASSYRTETEERIVVYADKDNRNDQIATMWQLQLYASHKQTLQTRSYK